MAIVPVELVLLLFVSGNIADTSQPQPAVNPKAKQISAERLNSRPILPRTPKVQLPLAIDQAGKVYEPVIPAIYEEVIQSEGESVRPTPQSPRKVNQVPNFRAVSSQNNENT